MKKTLYRLLSALLPILGLYYQSNAQCIKPNLPTVGFNTSSGDSFLCAPIGQPFNETVQLRIWDSLVGQFVEYVIFDSVTNLPAGITYSFDTTAYPTGRGGCLTFSGTATGNPGVYALEFYIQVKVSNFQVVKGNLRQLRSQFAPNEPGLFSIAINVPVSASQCNRRTSGIAFIDKNANCAFDTSDRPYANKTFILDNTTAVVTNQNGQYLIASLADGQHTLTVPPSGSVDFICPNSGTITFNVDTNNIINIIDFPLQPNLAFKDLSVNYLPIGTWLYGYEGHATITVRNDAYTTENATLKLDYDTSIVFVSADSTPSVNDVPAKHLEWSFTSIPPQSQRTVYLTFRMPYPTTQGIINNTFTVYPIAGDYDTANNTLRPGDFLFGAYDPNDIAVSPKGEDVDGKIRLSDSVLNYTIRFQNTGTASAVNIFVIDTLDSDMNPLTFKALTGSHKYSANIIGNKVVRFDFSQIWLPDSAHDEKGSHGFVQFSIRKKSGLGLGTVVKSRADIYFDFNAPVLTNTAISTYYNFTTGIAEAAYGYDMLLYPNPAATMVNFAFADEQKHTTINVLDITGRTMLTEIINNSKTIAVNTQNLSKGVYAVVIDSENGKFSRKLIIE